MPALTDTFTIAGDVEIPKIGFGTWQIPDGSEAYDAVRIALDAGYRHIDTALAYGNEESVGRAVRDSGVDRDESSSPRSCPPRSRTPTAPGGRSRQSQRGLDLGVVDLYLIHAPWPWDSIGSDHRAGNIEVWKVFEELYEQRPHALDRGLELLRRGPRVAHRRDRRRPAREPDPLVRRQHAGRRDRLVPAARRAGRGLLAPRDRPPARGRHARRHREARRPHARAGRDPLPAREGRAAAAQVGHAEAHPENADVDFALDADAIAELDAIRD